MRYKVGNRRAFSLIEMLVAAMLLSISVLAISAVSSKSLSSVKANREYEKAWEILDAQLTIIDAMGIDEFLESGRFEGEVGGGEDGASVHYWEVETEEGDWDNLYRVDLTISWRSGVKPRRIRASAVFNGGGGFSIDSDSEQSNAI